MKFSALEWHKRSIVKSISYRVLSLTVDSLVAYLFTRDVALSATIVIVVNTYSTVLYYLHERVWAHIHWGHTRLLATPFPGELKSESTPRPQ
ncbi:MAG: DUF2061 domain-containing protein [Patescibacteria group bacterium]